MTKFKKIILLSLLSLPLLTACAGNKDVIGTVYTFNYAQVN